MARQKRFPLTASIGASRAIASLAFTHPTAEVTPMRFGLRIGPLAVTAVALLWSGSAGATDFLIPGKIGIIRDQKLVKFVSKPTTAFTVPSIGSGGDPLIGGADVDIFDTDASGGMFDDLTAGEWSGLGNPPGISGYKYTNETSPLVGSVKVIILKPRVIKIVAKQDDSLQPGTVGGTLGVILSTGTTPDRYCAEFAGVTIKNDPTLFKSKDVTAPNACPSCPGLRFANACWFMGSLNAGCDATCASVGMVYDPATGIVAGSGGTDATCQTLLETINAPPGNVWLSQPCVGGWGCGVDVFDHRFRCTAPPTNSSDAFSTVYRACACIPS